MFLWATVEVSCLNIIVRLDFRTVKKPTKEVLYEWKKVYTYVLWLNFTKNIIYDLIFCEDKIKFLAIIANNKAKSRLWPRRQNIVNFSNNRLILELELWHLNLTKLYIVPSLSSNITALAVVMVKRLKKKTYHVFIIILPRVTPLVQTSDMEKKTVSVPAHLFVLP